MENTRYERDKERANIEANIYANTKNEFIKTAPKFQQQALNDCIIKLEQLETFISNNAGMEDKTSIKSTLYKHSTNEISIEKTNLEEREKKDRKHNNFSDYEAQYHDIDGVVSLPIDETITIIIAGAQEPGYNSTFKYRFMSVKTNDGEEFKLDTLFDMIKQSINPEQVQEAISFTNFIVDSTINHIRQLNMEDIIKIRAEQDVNLRNIENQRLEILNEQKMFSEKQVGIAQKTLNSIKPFSIKNARELVDTVPFKITTTGVRLINH